MKTGKYLKFYYESLEAGKMVPVKYSGKSATSGLCDAFGKEEVFELVYPTEDDFSQLEKEGKKRFTWASDSSDYLFYQFTPLRQNIVLLMACLNDEL